MSYVAMSSSVITVMTLQIARPTIRILVFRSGKEFSLLDSVRIRSESLIAVSKVLEA
jgi:hypothetical protein